MPREHETFKTSGRSEKETNSISGNEKYKN